MKISVAADELTGVAGAVLKELQERGHELLPHGALSEDERDDWA
jgi:ribose 5-phosphate isomerase B